MKESEFISFHSWFKRNYKKLGFVSIKKEKRGADFTCTDKDGQKINVELELLASNFLRHRHDESKVDIVVCLVNDINLPVKTIEVHPGVKITSETGIKRLRSKRKASFFVVVMGNTAFVRVVDFLLENRPFDYSKSEIAKNAGVGWSTLYGIWKVLERADIVRQTRMVGKSKMYRLNEENPVVRKLIELDADITELFAHKLVALLPIRVRSAKTSPPLVLPPT